MSSFAKEARITDGIMVLRMLEGILLPYFAE